MDSEKSIKSKIIIGILFFIPIIIIFTVVLFRNIITPTNEEIIDKLKNTKCYTSKVDYKFLNSKSDFEESTKQYCSKDKGVRIEFEDGCERVKVYKGSEIKVEENNENEYTLDKDIDIIYPLAFIENILSNPIQGDIQEIQSEWKDTTYLKINIEYNSKNNHLNKAEFYVDKKNETPELLRILDKDNKERIIITYKDFKAEKELQDDLF